LSFDKGEMLFVTDSTPDDWWYARSQSSGQEGYIPSGNVAEYGSIDAEE